MSGENGGVLTHEEIDEAVASAVASGMTAAKGPEEVGDEGVRIALQELLAQTKND